MKKKQLLLPLFVVALIGYLAYPHFREYSFYRSVRKSLTNIGVHNYLSRYPEGRYTAELTKAFDDQQIAIATKGCRGTGCCKSLKFYIDHDHPMISAANFTKALDSCAFYSTVGRPITERLAFYESMVGKGTYSAKLEALLGPNSLESLAEAAAARIAELSQLERLVDYLKVSKFHASIPIRIDYQMSLPKEYQSYSPVARGLLEESVLSDPDRFSGRRPERSDFESVGQPMWIFQFDDKAKRNVAELVTTHLKRYTKDKVLRLQLVDEELQGVRPRIEIIAGIRNMEDTIAGITVPIIASRSKSEYDTRKGLESDFEGFTMVPELFVRLTFYPKESSLDDFSYEGSGSQDNKVSSTGGSFDLQQETNRQAIDNATKNMLSKIYDQYPINY